MSTTATKKEGSYALSILSGAAAAVCMVVTALMVRQLGESLGATADGRQLLSAASVAVHLIGLVLMGLAFGYFEKQRGPDRKRLLPGWSFGTLALMILAGGFTMASIYGFVASERMSKSAALERQLKEEADDKKAAREVAQKKLDAQLDMTKGMVDWAKKSVKTDDLGRRERKDMLEAAQKAISNVTKEQEGPTRSAPASKEILMRPDSQAEGLSMVTGLSIAMIQNTLGMWLSFLLITLEMVLWPQATRMWPRRIAVDLIEAKPEVFAALSAGRDAGTALQPAPEQKALPAPTPEQIPVVREPAPKAPAIITLEPETVAIPVPLILLPGADLWLKSKGFELLPAKPGPLKDWVSKKQPAECQACWMQAYGLLGPFSHNQMSDLLARMCTAYHKKQPAWNVFAPELEKIKAIEVKKIRIDGQESPRPKRWYVASADRDIKKFAKESDPKQEASPDTGPRPLARASVSLPEAAANDNRRKKVAPAWLELQTREARQMKFMAQSNSVRSRKQRGARVGRMARAA